MLGIPEKIFSSVESSFWFSFHNLGDFKELIPEFFECSEFLINVEGAEIRNAETIPNVKIPTWAQDYQDFIEINRQALESDIVSENLHHWIDLIFGYKQIDQNNSFFDEAYGINEDYHPMQKEAYLLIAEEFGVCPVQLFSEPHPHRKFMKSHKIPDNSVLSSSPSKLIGRVAMLEHQLEVAQSNYSRELKAQEDKLKTKLVEQQHFYQAEHRKLKEKITMLQRENSHEERSGTSESIFDD